MEISCIPNLNQIMDVPIDELGKVYRVCQDLQSLCEKEKSMAISAVQVGIPWKLFLVKGDGTCPLISKDEYGYFINCTYEPTNKERVVSLERCLSVRSSDGQLQHFQVERQNIIKVFGIKLLIKSRYIVEKIDEEIRIDQQGGLFQHEIDHQEGKLISDVGKEIFIWQR